VGEVAFALFLLIQVAQRDIQTNRLVAHLRVVEPAWLRFHTRIETDGPLNNVALPILLRFGYTLHRPRLDPFAIRVPGLSIASGLALEQPADPRSTQSRLRQITHHLPALPSPRNAFIGLPMVRRVQ